MTTTSYEEYVKKDYRAFLFAIHPAHGMLLLYCTCKKKKGPHYQCPGGHVDREDYADAVSRIPKISSSDLLTLGCKIGVARELYEETGIDIRSTLEDRLQPVRLREDDSSDDNRVVGEFKERLFFRLNLEDGDFVSTGLDSSSNVLQSLNKTPPHLMLKLSHEHQGFVFQPDTTKAIDMLVNHSGGKVSKALRKAIEQGEIER